MNHVLNVDDLLQGVSPEAPCGEDLEYDAEFVAMEQAARGKEEQQMGDSVSPAEDGDWREVKNKALGLFKRSKDLRVAVYLTRALTKTDGLVGLHDGLDLVQGLLERYWDGLHPLLDPEDHNDPTIRVNTLLNLNGNETMLQPIREVELVAAKGLGRFRYLDLLIAEGKAPAPANPDVQPPSTAAIDAAFMACDLEELEERSEAAAGAVQLVAAIETTLMNQVGASHAVGMEPLVNLVKDLGACLTAQLLRRGVATVGAEVSEDGAAVPQPVSGEVRSREDVLRVLDKACEYFERNEPSSPVPLLLKRARRLVSKDFMDIVRDLAPGGVQEAEKIFGPEAD